MFVTRGNVSSAPSSSRSRSYGSYKAFRSELAAAGIRLSITDVSQLISRRTLVLKTNRRTLQMLGLGEFPNSLAA